MVHSLLRRLAPAALLAAAWAAQAQPAAPASRPDPLDAQASVPALKYTSPFAPVRRLSDDKPISWREANDSVARIGGWRVYAREAQAQAPSAPPKAPAAPASSGMAQPMPHGHAGHKTP